MSIKKQTSFEKELSELITKLKGHSDSLDELLRLYAMDDRLRTIAGHMTGLTDVYINLCKLAIRHDLKIDIPKTSSSSH